MKSAIMVDIICNDETARNIIKAEIPLIDDPRIWPDDYTAPAESTDEFGNTHLNASIRCNLESDQAIVSENIIQKVLDNATVVESGSSVKLHICFHDEIPPKGCTESILYEVA